MCQNMDEAWKHYVKWKKQDIKDHILYYFIYVKCPELADLLRQEMD